MSKKTITLTVDFGNAMPDEASIKRWIRECLSWKDGCRVMVDSVEAHDADTPQKITVGVYAYRGIPYDYAAFTEYESALKWGKHIIPDDELDDEYSNKHYRCTRGLDDEVWLETVKLSTT